MNIRRMYQFTISGLGLLGICLMAASAGQAQWVQSGSNMYYTKGNISVGTTTPFGQFTIGNYTLGSPYGSFIFNQGAFTLKGLKNSNYFPYLEFRDENNARASYLGWGSKSGKYLDWQFENGYNLAIKGGRVGIGTAPLTKFHIKGSAAQDAILFIQPGEWNSAGDYGELRFGDTSHYIRGEYLTGMTLYDANKFQFMGGNVAIGSTNPVEKLDVNGNLILRDYTNVAGKGSYIHFTSYGWDCFGPKIRSAMEFAAGTASRAKLILSSYYNGYKDELTLMNGNVGVGTTNPRDRLEVAGILRVSNPDGAQGQIYSENWDGGNFIIHGLSKHLSFYTAPNGRIRFTDPYGTEKVSISSSGNVVVYGKLEAKEVKISNSPVADFVFEPDYQLMSLNEVEQRVKADKHLPGIPSAKEIEANGVSVGDMQAKQLQKIEELTLYMIEMNKQLSALQQENARLNAEVLKLRQARQ